MLVHDLEDRLSICAVSAVERNNKFYNSLKNYLGGIPGKQYVTA